MNAGSSRPAGLVLRGVVKDYGSVRAVDGCSVEITEGEFVTLLGPSGSGKTTLLRLIAGFSRPTAGRIELSGADITDVPPHRRDLGMVFQNYALFPHMTVADNIAFPLRMRRVNGRERERRVGEALSLVDLAGLGRRYPRQLSGGQQQRVAVARAIVFNPRVLLMDEPLGALDKRLRDSLQVEIKRLHEELGITVVYVTHDQEEALALSDRIAIMHDGRIDQLGTGRDLYEHPASVFVANFMGESNLLCGRLEHDGTGRWLMTPSGRLRVVPSAPDDAHSNGSAALVIRPETVGLFPQAAAAGDGEEQVTAVVTSVTYLGPSLRYELAAAGQRMIVRAVAGNGHEFVVGDQVVARWPIARGRIVPANESCD